jgi:inhibitor of cysteine peptidase
MNKLVLIVLALVIALPAFCSVSAPTAVFTDPQKTIEAKVGEDVIITLESNRTTGFEWQLSRDPDEGVAKFNVSEYIPNETGLTGSGGREIWTFKAMGIGKTEIAFKYVRPWEEGIAPADEKTFKVEVK